MNRLVKSLINEKLMINYMIINVQPSKREARSKLFPINIFINVFHFRVH